MSIFVLIVLVRTVLAVNGGGLATQRFGIDDVVPAPQLTDVNMQGTQLGIKAYLNDNHRLPAKLSDLPVSPESGDETIDGWGQPLLYAPHKDGSVDLGDLGKDGKSPRWLRFTYIAKGDKGDDEGDALLTFSNFEIIEDGIRRFAAIHKRLPNGLAELCRDDDISDFTKDEWGGPISYEARADGTVELSSKGKAGRKDRAFALTFRVNLKGQAAPATASAPWPMPVPSNGQKK